MRDPMTVTRYDEIGWPNSDEVRMRMVSSPRTPATVIRLLACESNQTIRTAADHSAYAPADMSAPPPAEMTAAVSANYSSGVRVTIRMTPLPMKKMMIKTLPTVRTNNMWAWPRYDIKSRGDKGFWGSVSDQFDPADLWPVAVKRIEEAFPSEGRELVASLAHRDKPRAKYLMICSFT